VRAKRIAADAETRARLADAFERGAPRRHGDPATAAPHVREDRRRAVASRRSGAVGDEPIIPRPPMVGKTALFAPGVAFQADVDDM
jgi:hypothetical protein